MFDFPTTPPIGTAVTVPDGSVRYWDGQKWDASSSGSATPAPLHGLLIANVVDYGADASGVADSTSAFVAALATGSNVYAPAGTYRINSMLTVGATSAQTLFGDGLATILQIDQAFDANTTTSPGVINLGGTEQYASTVRDLWARFIQPQTTTTAAATAAIGTNTITLASAANIAVGNGVTDVTNASAINIFTTVTAIAGNVVTISASLLAAVASGDTICFGPMRGQFKTLAAGGTSATGGTGVMYPPAIYYNNTNRWHLARLRITCCWEGILQAPGSSSGGWWIEDIEISPFNCGLRVGQNLDFSHIRGWHHWAFDMVGQQHTGVQEDGNCWAMRLGDGNTLCQAVNATDISTLGGHILFDGQFSGGNFFANLMIDGGAYLENRAGLQNQISNVYFAPGTTQMANPSLKMTGGNLFVTNISAGNIVPQIITFTGSISGTTLTASGVSGGSLGVGTNIRGAGISLPNPTVITALGTGTGGSGTYTVNIAQTVGTEVMTAGVPTLIIGQTGGALIISNGLLSTANIDRQMISQSGGSLQIRGVEFLLSSGSFANPWTIPAIHVTGGAFSFVGNVVHSYFPAAAPAGFLQIDQDSFAHNVDAIAWPSTHYFFPPSGALGNYSFRRGPQNYHLSYEPTVYGTYGVLTTVATTASAIGTNTITVANVAGVMVGNIILDFTTGDAILPGTTVVGVAGNVVTLSASLADIVANNDTISFTLPAGPAGAVMMNLSYAGALHLGSGTGAIVNDSPLFVNGGGYSDNSTYTYSAPVSGSTVTLADNVLTHILNPGATLASLTVAMPLNALRNNNYVRIATTQTITALTLQVQPTSGHSINAPPTTLAANSSLLYLFNGSTWFRMQ